MKKNMKATAIVNETLSREPNHVLIKVIVVSILVALSYWSISSITDVNFNENGVRVARNVIRYFFLPDGTTDQGEPIVLFFFLTLESHGVPYLMYETIMIAFLGTLFGAVLAVPIAFLASKNITGTYVSGFGITLITLIRTMPVFVWAMFFLTIASGAFAGVLAISVTSIGMISKLFIEAIEDIDKGILEALDSTGATTLQKIRYGIIPQLTANFLSTIIYRFEINVKNATILGLVGAGGIGTTMMGAIGSFNFSLVAVCLWGIIPVVFVIEFFSTKIRTKITTGE